MADLENSERRLLRATYAPVDPRRRVSSKKALAKRSYAASLQITHAELDRLKRSGIHAPPPKPKETIAVESASSSLLDSAATFAEVDWHSLIAVGEELVKLREQDLLPQRPAAPKSSTRPDSKRSAVMRLQLTRSAVAAAKQSVAIEPV